MKHFGDITKLSGYNLPIVDLITGGSPCQDLSLAGKREGLKKKCHNYTTCGFETDANSELERCPLCGSYLDLTRSGLFMEQIRIVKEMRERDRQNGRAVEYLRPRYMVWENVPGAFSSNGGKDFQAVLTEIVRIADPDAPDVPLPEKNGRSPDASTMRWASGQLLGEYTMPSFGESPREENASRLSQILEDSPHPRFALSARACKGILNRAERRGKKLPEPLERALKAQAQSVFKSGQESRGAEKES